MNNDEKETKEVSVQESDGLNESPDTVIISGAVHPVTLELKRPPKNKNNNIDGPEVDDELDLEQPPEVGNPKDRPKRGKRTSQKKSNKIDPNIVVYTVVGIVILAIIVLQGPINNYTNNISNHSSVPPDQLVMIDIIGYDIDEAVAELERNEILYTIREVSDPYTADGNILKTSRDYGEFISIYEEIEIYVNKSTATNANSGAVITTESTPFIRNSITVSYFGVIGDEFYIIIENGNSLTVKDIEYTISYKNNDNEGVGTKTFKVNSANILPGQKFELRNEIKNASATHLEIDSFNCTL